MLWPKKHPPLFLHTTLQCFPSPRKPQVVGLTHCWCLSALEDWKLVPSVTNIPWKRVVKRTVDISGQARAPLGLKPL